MYSFSAPCTSHQSPFFAEVLPLAVRLPRLWGVCSPGSSSLAVHLGVSLQLVNPSAISNKEPQKKNKLNK